jgi:hypothetical protein
MYHLLRKQIVILAVAALAYSNSFGQFGKVQNRTEHDDKPYYFGMTLAMANATFRHENTPAFLATDTILNILPGFTPAFSLGLMATYHPYKRWEFRANPQLILGLNRSFRYRLKDPLPGEGFLEKRSVQSTVVSFPFSVKFNSDRLQNFRMYLLGGVQGDFDLASNAASRNGDNLLKLKKFDYGLHYGLGFNLYLPFVTITPEIKFVWGIADLHSRSANLKYSNTIDQINSKMIVFSLHLEE